jgi:uncharacterized protein (TIGR02145 family)
MKTKNKIWLFPLIVIGLVLILTNSCKKDETNNNPSGSITDKDGNVYTSVNIGTQVWMVENLKTTKYNDNTNIPLVTENTAWANLTTPGYCWYNNDASTYKASYGAMYNWYALSTGKLCPTGWHVPTDDEWTTLTTFLGGANIAGGKLKETGTAHWLSPNTGATNETGFSAIPGGLRGYSNGIFISIGEYGYWWSSSLDFGNQFFVRNLFYNAVLVWKSASDKQDGLSVRCIKN